MNVSRVLFRGLVAGVAVVVGIATGCGSSSDNGTPASGGTSAGGSGATAGDATSGGSLATTGGTSATTGGTSASSGGSSTTGGTSTAGTTGVDSCKAADAACQAGTECCSFACVSGKCSSKQCVADNVACTSDGECCGGKCTDKLCVPLNTSCTTSGQACDGHSKCCSQFCDDGKCSAAPSFCRQMGDACASDIECCGGLCSKKDGSTLGTCALAIAPDGVGSCTPAGQVCGDGATYSGGPLPTCGGECCSRSCRPYAATGVLICQPPSGCRPTGELCQTDNDCCGAPGSAGSTKIEGGSGQPANVHCSKAPGATIGRCENGEACSPGGAICRLEAESCNATDRCCSGTVQQHPLNCQLDALQIPRCTVVPDRDCDVSGAPPAGTACASSADCCNLPCVPNPSGTPPFVCSGAKCIPSGGQCTTTADCCTGSPCIIRPGATKGTCGDSGTPGGSGGAPSTGGAGGASSAGTTSTPGGGTVCGQYGQQCSPTAGCCNGVPCTEGYCVYSVK